ncbi:cytochrome ubiquinol oxidase subunit I [Desulfobotulus sp. H1]|uniref:Cytochrome ubiquinol oxidase subunit I n=1 Tax=Desulfobotulus pelophilus TaxID=2823377 RepID=A0ABT3N6T4_9BACT|nr:cytochrome ubiquinol oxidase subunit I [Desulfobotulus pelophilus]MCW7753170.1 cytochrome ubiquinol oxidase subunit I [Desulfobotulus pelophilus]
MDVVLLSRLQFAATTMFHFLFVPLTLGLSILVAWMETRYARTGDEVYLRMTKFWGKLFLINFAVGVVTGITLEFQFGTNWSQYSAYVGDIFGSLLAIEATAAFFLESTFIGIWIFGWKRLSAKAHAGVMWMVAIAGNASAIWILIANAWMQHPVGYTLRESFGGQRAEITDFMAVITQKFAWLTIMHTIAASIVLACFFVMGISAWHLLRKQHEEVFTRSFRMALVPGLIFSLFVAIQGDFHAVDVAHTQPAKMAAMEFHWETQPNAPSYLFAWPDPEAEKNSIEIGKIPGMLSFLIHHDFSTPVTGLKDIPKDERPPIALVGMAFRVMVGLGAYFIIACSIGWFFRKRLQEKTWYLKMMLWSIPLPYIATQAGWLVTEVGRQPWIVYGLMKTSDAVSPISTGQVATSLVAFIVVYGLLGLAGFTMIAKKAMKGPDLPEATETKA